MLFLSCSHQKSCLRPDAVGDRLNPAVGKQDRILTRDLGELEGKLGKHQSYLVAIALLLLVKVVPLVVLNSISISVGHQGLPRTQAAVEPSTSSTSSTGLSSTGTTPSTASTATSPVLCLGLLGYGPH